MKTVVSTCKLADVQKYMDRSIDVCAIVADIESTRIVELTTGGTATKQRVLVVDDSATLVSLELWNDSVNSLDGSVGQCILLKGVKVKRYRDLIYLRLSPAGVIHTEPERSAEVTSLQEWYRVSGDGGDLREIKPRDEEF